MEKARTFYFTPPANSVFTLLVHAAIHRRGTPRLTAEQIISILRRHGFRRAGSSGSHQKCIALEDWLT